VARRSRGGGIAAVRVVLNLAAFGPIERGQADHGWTSVVRIADILGVSLEISVASSTGAASRHL
jgi:hypothetical protein